MSGAHGYGEPLPETPYLVSPALRQRLDLVHHLLEFGNRLVILQGPRGAGRSRMLDAVCAEADAGWTVLQPLAGDLDGPARLRALLAHELALTDVDAAGTPELDSEIARALARLEADRRLCLVAVDDADDLPDAVLETLFRLAHTPEGSGRVRVVLVATEGSDLVQRIEGATPEPALVHVVAVPALTDAQAAELRALTGGDDAGASAYPGAAGVDPPQPVESQRGAAQPGEARPGHPSAGHPRRLAGALVLGAVVVAGILVALLGGRDPAPAREPLVVALPKAPGDPVSPAVEQGATAETDVEPTLSPTPAQAVDTRSGTPPAVRPTAGDAADTAAPDETAAVTNPVDVATAPVTSPDPAAAAAEVTDAPHAATAPAPVEDRPSAADPATAPAPAASPGAAAVSSPPPTAPAAAPASSPSPPVTRGETPRSAPPAQTKESEQSALEGVYSAKWVLTQPAESYVVQLFGVRERAGAVRFLRDNPSARPAAIVELTHEGAPWYVVVHGHYPDRDSARAAIQTLPPRLAAFRPWARPVQSLRP